MKTEQLANLRKFIDEEGANMTSYAILSIDQDGLFKTNVQGNLMQFTFMAHNFGNVITQLLNQPRQQPTPGAKLVEPVSS